MSLRLEEDRLEEDRLEEDETDVVFERVAAFIKIRHEELRTLLQREGPVGLRIVPKEDLSRVVAWRRGSRDRRSRKQLSDGLLSFLAPLDGKAAPTTPQSQMMCQDHGSHCSGQVSAFDALGVFCESHFTMLAMRLFQDEGLKGDDPSSWAAGAAAGHLSDHRSERPRR